MLTPKRTTLGLPLVGVVLLALVSVVMLGPAAAARADEGADPLTGVRHATATAKQQAPATTAPPSGSSSAEGATGARPAASEQPAQPDPEAAVNGSRLAGQSPPSPPQTTGMEISQAVKEAIGQASTKQPQHATPVGQGSLAAASNATAQLIWQVEISPCTSDCYGTKQYQSAEQQNTTRQQITTAPAPGGEHGAPVTGERSQATSNVTQIQFGCLSHCFGTTTTTQPPLAPYGQVLAELLRQITTALSGLSPAAAAEQSAVEQISFQSQSAAGGTLTQVQSAVQSSTTSQSYTSSPVAGPGSEPVGPQPAGEGAVNQTEQGIWQLQIGCLFLCHETAQYQQAEQSNATQQTIVSAPGSAAKDGASASDIVTQVIWQVQIGCLFWCFDTTEQQAGTTRNDLTATQGEGAAAPPAPEASSNSSGTENQAAPLPATTASSQAPPEALATQEAQTPPPAAQDGSMGAPAPAPLATITTPVREHAAILSEASVTTAGSDRRGASPRRSTIAHRPASRDARGADAPAGFATRRAQERRPGGGSVRRSARRLPLPSGAAAAGTSFGSPGREAPGRVGVLLAVIALFGAGCLPIAVIRTRRGSRASHEGMLTSK
jgi:hypothetical protein